jgi:hypothetical protein
MFHGDLMIFNSTNSNKIIPIELSDEQIDNFKKNIEEIFKLNNWNISTAKFQKSGFGKLYPFGQMENSDFVFGKVNCFLNLSI